MNIAEINEIIVHCSFTKAKMNIGADWIKKVHVNEKKFKDIGYHFVIRRDGTIENGRPINKIGEHCLGHNADTIGICMVGGMSDEGKPEDNFTPEQFAQLRQTIIYLQGWLKITRISGHRDYDKNKACPCFEVTEKITY